MNLLASTSACLKAGYYDLKSRSSIRSVLKHLALSSLILLYSLVHYSVVYAASLAHEFAYSTDEGEDYYPYLPFPSNTWTESNTNSPTGLVVNVDDSFVREELLDLVVPGVVPNQLLEGWVDVCREASVIDVDQCEADTQGSDFTISGFSPAGAVLFQLPDVPSTQSILPDGTAEIYQESGPSIIGDGAIIFHKQVTSDGSISLNRIPIRTEMNLQAQSINDEKDLVKQHIFDIRPRSRFEPGQTYIAILTHHIVDRAGRAFPRSNNLQVAVDAYYRDDEANDPNVQARWDENFAALNIEMSDANFVDEQLMQATEFTIRGESEYTAPIVDIVKKVYLDDHPLEIRDITFKEHGDIALVVGGMVSITDFRKSWAGDSVRTFAGDMGVKHMVEFVMTIPRSASEQAAPVAVYGHGLGVVKETILVTMVQNAELGVATIAIDQPNHGWRITRDEEGNWDDIFSLARSSTGISSVIGIAQQSPIDFVSLVKAVSSKLVDLDVMPFESMQAPAEFVEQNQPNVADKSDWQTFMVESFSADGKADLDVDRIFYQGTSLGGVFGSGFVAITPDIKGAFFQVTGAGITDTLMHTSLWPVLLDGMVPEIATPAEVAVLVNAFQLAIDAVDGLALAHWYRNPPTVPGLEIPKKSILLEYGIDDEIVPNTSSRSFAEVIGMPHLVTSRIKSQEELPADAFPVVSELPTDGTVVYQSTALLPSLTQNLLDLIGAPSLFGNLPHFSFVQNYSINLMKDWMEVINVDADPAENDEDDVSRGLAGDSGTPDISAGALGIKFLLLLGSLVLVSLVGGNRKSAKLVKCINPD